MIVTESGNIIIELLDVVMFEQGKVRSSFINKLSFSALSFRFDSQAEFGFFGKVIPVNTGDIAFVPQGAEYERRCERENMIVFHFNVMGRITKDIRVFTPENEEKYRKLFLAAYELWKIKSSGYRLRVTAILYEILSEMQSDGEYITSDVDAFVQTVIDEIEMSFSDCSFKIDDLSKKHYISPAYLRRKFKKNTGQSPKEYLIKRRITEAQIMLRSGYFSQTEISEKSGFSDVKYFRYAFKQMTGKTLSEYKTEIDNPALQ